MISVIVPVYNVDKYLNRCIESILNQTFKNIELILINDGSSDESERICLEWAKKDDRIIFISKVNEGQGIARNLGIKLSKGEYITFVDSDDWLELSALEKMHSAMINNTVDIVTCDLYYTEFHENGNIYVQNPSKLRITPYTIMSISEHPNLINRARLFLWGKLYKREILIHDDLSQPNHAFEDTAVIPLIIAKASTLYHVPECFYNYLRNRCDSTVNSVGSLKYMVKSLENIKRKFIASNLFDIYYDELRKLSLSQVRFTFKKANELFKDNYIDEFNNLILDLYSFMNINYPEWFNIENYSVGVIGSDFMKRVVENMIFDSEQIQYHMQYYQYDYHTTNVNLIFIDFINSYIFEDIGAWKNQIAELTKFSIEQKNTEIILVKNYFILNNEEDYRLEDLNNLIEKQYEIFKTKCKEAIIVENPNGLTVNKNNLSDFKILNEDLSWNMSEKLMQILEKVVID